jgi:hypothetical protein
MDFNWDSWTKDNCRLILVLRDYREAILRHALALGKNKQDKEIQKCVEHYLHCLDSYDNFEGDKIIFYYEDIVTNPRKEIESLCRFLNIHNSPYLKTVLNNIKYHQRSSLLYYKPGSMTRGAANKLDWHTKHSNPQMVKRIEKEIKSHGDVYHRFLKRYK